MKKMKKVIALLLAAVLCLGLCTTAMADAPANVAGTYGWQEEVKGTPIKVDWTLTLNVDGTFSLSEDNSLFGTTNYTGESWSVVYSDVLQANVVTTSPVIGGEPKGSFFNEDFSCQWILGANESMEPLTIDMSGTYTWHEEVPNTPIKVDWTLTLNKDGSFKIVEANNLFGTTEYTGKEWTADGNIVTTGPLDSGEPKGDFFNADAGYTAGWEIDKVAGTVVGVALEDSEGGEGEGEAAPEGATSVEYKEGLNMDVYLPANYDESKEYPLLVTSAGGAFFSVATSNFEEVCQDYAADGYICANITYTVGDGNFPQGIIDAKTAVQYMVDNYKIDADDITMMGESAGAYIATMAAISGPSDFKETGAADYTFDVANLVNLYGPMYDDARLEAYWGDAATKTLADDFFKTGNTDLRVWMAHGTADENVTYETNAVVLANGLKEAGFDVTFNTYEGMGHMLVTNEAWCADNLRVVEKWIKGSVDSDDDKDDNPEVESPETGEEIPIATLAVIIAAFVVTSVSVARRRLGR